MHLHADDFFKALKTGRLRGWMDGAEPQHEIVFEAIGSAAAVYASGGYFVVVDTLIRRQFLEALARNIMRNNVPAHLVVLRPSFNEVLARSNLRDPKLRHDDDILRWLYNYFTDLGDLEQHVINNSDHAPDQTMEAIQAMVRSGGARLRPLRGDRSLRRPRQGR